MRSNICLMLNNLKHFELIFLWNYLSIRVICIYRYFKVSIILNIRNNENWKQVKYKIKLILSFIQWLFINESLSIIYKNKN